MGSPPVLCGTTSCHVAMHLQLLLSCQTILKETKITLNAFLILVFLG